MESQSDSSDCPECVRSRNGRNFPNSRLFAVLLNQKRTWIQVFLSLTILLITAATSSALTIEELRNDANLTPERFMAHFRNFKFELSEKLQSPEVFLATQTGDCDDFASLAAEILREKKYTTRLIVVFMDGQTHVICYVKEIKGYLDYNHRQSSVAVQTTDGNLEDMADQVARYFKSRWRCVSEYAGEGGGRSYGRIAFR
jgi:hypothetical protein